MTTNPLPLAAVRAIKSEAEKATQGPWLWSGPCENWSYWPRFLNGPKLETVLGPDDSRSTESVSDMRIEIDPCDQDFIAHARTNVPALCNLVDTLVEALRKYGQHERDCGKNIIGNPLVRGRNCTCGFDTILASLNPQPAKPNASGGDAIAELEKKDV